MAKFFIRRPVFAWVIAIVIMLGGALAISTLSISQYPDIAPTTVRIAAGYNGASAETVEKSVTSIIEDGMTGLDDLTYMTSASSTGSATVTLTSATPSTRKLLRFRCRTSCSSSSRNCPTSCSRRASP